MLIGITRVCAGRHDSERDETGRLLDCLDGSRPDGLARGPRVNEVAMRARCGWRSPPVAVDVSTPSYTSMNAREDGEPDTTKNRTTVAPKSEREIVVTRSFEVLVTLGASVGRS